jgi:hypothetical protein
MALEGIVQVIVFPDKASVWVIALIYNEDNELTDPTQIVISIFDPDSKAQVDEEVMTQYKETEGIYEYFYHKGTSADPMDTGQWKGEIMTIDGEGDNAIISLQTFTFSVQ